MVNLLEPLLHYGEKRKYNLIIKIAGFESLMDNTRESIAEKVEELKGNFIVTDQGYLLRGSNVDLETRCGTLDLSESGNVEGLLNLKSITYFQDMQTKKIRGVKSKEKDRIHIHYHVDNPPVIIGTDYIVRGWKGLRIEAYIPVLKREPILKKRIGERELVPSFGFA